MMFHAFMTPLLTGFCPRKQCWNQLDFSVSLTRWTISEAEPTTPLNATSRLTKLLIVVLIQ